MNEGAVLDRADSFLDAQVEARSAVRVRRDVGASPLGFLNRCGNFFA